MSGPPSGSGSMPPIDLSVLMPVFNERETVETAIAQTLGASLPANAIEVIVVDDGSSDGTREILAGQAWPAHVRILFHDRNRGKGAAIQTALKVACGSYAAIMDADLEYDPAEIGRLLPPLMKGDADAVFGVRGFESHSAFNFWYVVGNKGVTLTANVLYNSWLSDIMTCHKVMRTDLFRSLRLRERGFGIEPEITARLLRQRARIYEVPISYRSRGRDEGKKLTALDGLRVLRTLLRCRID